MGNSFLIGFWLVVFSGVCGAQGEKIYTNADLEKYKGFYSGNVSGLGSSVPVFIEMKRSDDRESDKIVFPDKNVGKDLDFEWEKLIGVHGCPALQDGSRGAAVMSIIPHGRTVAQICRTLFLGCERCYEVKIGDNPDVKKKYGLVSRRSGLCNIRNDEWVCEEK